MQFVGADAYTGLGSPNEDQPLPRPPHSFQCHQQLLNSHRTSYAHGGPGTLRLSASASLRARARAATHDPRTRASQTGNFRFASALVGDLARRRGLGVGVPNETFWVAVALLPASATHSQRCSRCPCPYSKEHSFFPQMSPEMRTGAAYVRKQSRRRVCFRGRRL